MWPFTKKSVELTERPDAHTYVTDEVIREAMRLDAKDQCHKEDLVWALRSRVLTDAEMAEIKRYGIRLLTRAMVPYFEEEVSRQFNDLLLHQFSLQLAARATPAKEPE